MKFICKYCLVLILITEILASCSTIEKASTHGLANGYYTLKSDDKSVKKVYLDFSNEQINVYPLIDKVIDKSQFMTLPILTDDTVKVSKMVFKKQSLDIDFTSILLKYRPSVYGLPAQLNTDLNFAMYVGWRFDNYFLKTMKDPLGRRFQKIGNLGYDFGFFAGPGTTSVSPFTTLNKRNDEYSAIILQSGIAGFIESNVASFGFSLGYDYLLNSDRKIWIYRNKPWIGFIVGIALN